MAKRYDPWSKKSKKGMKSLGKAFDFTVKATSLANSKSKKKNYNTVPQREYTEKDWTFAFIFLIVFIVIIISIISLFDINYRGFFGFIKFIIVMIGSTFASGIITFILISSFESKPKKRRKDSINKEEEIIINNIAEILAVNQELLDIKNVYSENELTKKVLINSFEKATDTLLNKGVLSNEREKRLSDFIDMFELTQDELNQNRAYEKIVQSAILRIVLDGEIPQKFELGEQVPPFPLNKNEKLIWVCSNVNYSKENFHNNFVGGISGPSMKVAKGLYYKTSNFKGQEIEPKSLKYQTTGVLGFTDKHIYFYSKVNNFRISYSKIMILEPYENTIRLQKNGITARPQIFCGISGWFAYNLIINLKNKN